MRTAKTGEAPKRKSLMDFTHNDKFSSTGRALDVSKPRNEMKHLTPKKKKRK
jgi:hypothetical protein